jgi:hypothetical protein
MGSLLINGIEKSGPNKKALAHPKNDILIGALPYDIWNYILLLLSSNEHNILRLLSHHYKNIIKNFYNKNHLRTCQSFMTVLEEIKNVCIKNGYLSLFEWCYENCLTHIDIINKGFRRNTIDENTSIMKFHYQTSHKVIFYGHLNLLIWLNKNVFIIDYNNTHESDKLIQKTALGGHLHILKWLMTEIYGEKKFKEYLSSNVSSLASASGNLDLLKWLRKQGCVFDDYTCIEASRNGHIHIIKWFRKKIYKCFSTNLYYCAALRGHLHVIEWLLEEDEKEKNIQKKKEEELRKIHDLTRSILFEIIRHAAIGGHLHVIQWGVNYLTKDRTSDLRTNFANDPPDQRFDCLIGTICIGAAMGGHLHVIKWAEKNLTGNIFEWLEDIEVDAWRLFRLDIISWIREKRAWGVINNI